MNCDRYGNPICIKCGQAKDYTQFGLTGICYRCYRLMTEARAIADMLPSRRINENTRSIDAPAD